MKKISTILAAVATLLAVGFTSCHSGEEDEPTIPEIPEIIKDLISTDVPAEGWSGNQVDGILKFAPDEYEAGDANTYFAFEMKGGKCQSGVYNVVMPRASDARQLAKMLNDGTWIDIDDDDDDDDDFDFDLMSRVSKSSVKTLNMASKVINFVKNAGRSRANITLPITVHQDGKVVYIYLPNFEGLSAEDLQKAVDLWSGRSWEVPQRVVFGKYENGVYTCHNMHGMNITYQIVTEYNANDFCTQYITTLTLPTENWALFYYEIYEEQMDDFEYRFGRRPELKKIGNEVQVNAVIIGNVPRADVESMIYTIDWVNNCPFIFSIFE